MKPITLIKPAANKNGLIAYQDSYNNKIYNLRKIAISGRDNGLVYRYNTKTNTLLLDGTTHRVYVSYDNLCNKDIYKLCEKIKQI